jgi:hypothetical protein
LKNGGRAERAEKVGGLTVFLKNAAENGVSLSRQKSRLTTLRDSKEAENREPQLQKQRGNF